MKPLDPDHRELHDELDPLDELASAHLDGLTSAAEEARIASDPGLQARVAAMEAVRAALRDPVPVDEASRDRAIGAALAAYDADHQAAPVSDLSAAAARRSAQRRTLRILGIAAAVVLLVIAVPLLVGLGDDGSDADLAATSGESADEPSDAEESATFDASGGAIETAEGRSEADAQADAPGAEDREAGEGGDDADDSEREHSGEPSPLSTDGARRLGLLDEVQTLGQRLAALVLEALRLLGQPGDP